MKSLEADFFQKMKKGALEYAEKRNDFELFFFMYCKTQIKNTKKIKWFFVEIADHFSSYECNFYLSFCTILR